jgi:hypothetical protein
MQGMRDLFGAQNLALNINVKRTALTCVKSITIIIIITMTTTIIIFVVIVVVIIIIIIYI